jgi:hypothetical protein
MSYDLGFDREELLPEEDVIAYLEERPNYTPKIYSNDDLGRYIQATYQNPDTGVHFILSVWDQSRRDQFEVRNLAGISLNFCRPSYFVMETGIEVGAFTKHFGLTVKDVQAGTDGTFSTETFVKSWMVCNQTTSGWFQRQVNPVRKLYTRPSTELMKIWRWNYQLRDAKAKFGDKVVIPRIRWMLVDGELHSAVLWANGAPAFIPGVEKVVIWRSEIPAPAQIIELKDLCIVGQSVLDEYLAPLKSIKEGLPMRSPTYVDVPDNVKEFIMGLKPEERPIEFLAMDRVLDGAPA